MNSNDNATSGPDSSSAWNISGDFGRAEGQAKPIDGGIVFDNGTIRVTTLSVTDHAGILWRRTSVKNVSHRTISAQALFDRFSLDCGEYDVYTQCDAMASENRSGNWQSLATNVEVRASGTRTKPILAVWNRQTNRGRVFHLVTDTLWSMRVTLAPDNCTNDAVVVETGIDNHALCPTIAPGESVALPEIISFEFTNRLDLDCHKLHAWWHRRHPSVAMPNAYRTWTYSRHCAVGNAPCSSSAPSQQEAQWLKQLFEDQRADNAFWSKAIGRILVDTPEITIFQYSDEWLGDVRIYTVAHNTRQRRISVYPVLDQSNSYRANGILHGPNDIADNGIEATVPSDGAASLLRLERVWPTGSVRQSAAWHRQVTRRHLGIPSIAVSPVNGRMWSVFYCGKTPGEDLNCYVVMMTSADNGRTWKEVLVADPDEGGPLRAFDSELWVAPDGKLRWTWTERLCRYGGNPDAPYGMHDGYFDTDRLMMATLSAEDEPNDLPEPVCIANGVMMCKPFLLADGTWIFPVAKWRQAQSVCFYASTDGGKTFTMRGGATLPEELRLYDEHCGVQLRNGDILSFIRVANRDGAHPHETISHDGGATWDTPCNARFDHTSSRVFLSRLKSGNLLLVKNGKFDQNVGRKEMMAFISRDDGNTWEGGLMLDERDGVSYPDGDQRADGTIVITYDHDRMNAMDILFAEFTEDDVLAGKDVSGHLALRRTIYSRLP